MNSFFSPQSTSLKVCGVTRAEDAIRLAQIGVHALGVNFWPHSKRYISPEDASLWLSEVSQKILRVGVFVNAEALLPRRLLDEGIIDIAQFHGDESPDYCRAFAESNLPFIKAIGVKNKESMTGLTEYQATALLFDTPAPGLYGGTGEVFDWTHARQFILAHPETPVLLAGGIVPDNAAAAIRDVQPAALDVASGAEFSPGIKDFKKVTSLLASCTNSNTTRHSNSTAT